MCFEADNYSDDTARFVDGSFKRLFDRTRAMSLFSSASIWCVVALFTAYGASILVSYCCVLLPGAILRALER